MQVILKFGGVLGFILAMVIGMGLLTQIKVVSVRCRAESGDCTPEVRQKLESLTSQSFFFSDLESASTQILSTLPGYKLMSLQRQLPQTLVISIKQNPSLYRLQALGKPELKVVDSEGFIYSPESQTTIPLVVVSEAEWNESLQQGRIQINRHQQLTQTLQALSQAEISFQQLEAAAGVIGVLSLDPQTAAILDLSNSAADVAKLSIVLKGLEPATLSEIQEIDVRYRLPVLRPNRTIPRHDS
jgi:cell division septal protein FtsQ